MPTETNRPFCAKQKQQGRFFCVYPVKNKYKTLCSAYTANDIFCKSNRLPREPEKCPDFLGNRRSAVLRRIFCAGKSVSSAALLGVMQGKDTKSGAEETSKTVLRKFPRKSKAIPRKDSAADAL